MMCMVTEQFIECGARDIIAAVPLVPSVSSNLKAGWLSRQNGYLEVLMSSEKNETREGESNKIDSSKLKRIGRGMTQPRFVAEQIDLDTYGLYPAVFTYGTASSGTPLDGKKLDVNTLDVIHAASCSQEVDNFKKLDSSVFASMNTGIMRRSHVQHTNHMKKECIDLPEGTINLTERELDIFYCTIEDWQIYT